MVLDNTLVEIKHTLTKIDAILETIQSQNNTLAPEAINLLQYVVTSSLANHTLQRQLASQGFSSLGRSQSHIRHTIRKILSHIHGTALDESIVPMDFEQSITTKQQHAKVFGEASIQPKIMVTLPTEAAEDIKMLETLVDTGVTLFRINTAHDTPSIWKKMADNIIMLRSKTNIDLKIYVDLAGPKIRTSAQETKKIDIKIGDKIKLINKPIIGKSVTGKSYRAKIGCSNPDIFTQIHPLHAIYLDDGKIGGTVSSIEEDGLIFEVRSLANKGGKIKAEKGINFPDSTIILPALTEDDRKNLSHVVGYADIIGLSFAQNAHDIAELDQTLQAFGSTAAIVPKIETKHGAENLLTILLALIETKRYTAIMIARGDLAIEVGFENLPLVQQEIIDLCNAACMPIIYATQVLESKMKTNIPSRAEAIDAAYANRSDCIMLNKGPFTKEAVSTLLSILGKFKDLYENDRHLLHIIKNWEQEVTPYIQREEEQP